jgi:hypothetical protein
MTGSGNESKHFYSHLEGGIDEVFFSTQTAKLRGSLKQFSIWPFDDVAPNLVGQFVAREKNKSVDTVI